MEDGYTKTDCVKEDSSKIMFGDLKGEIGGYELRLKELIGTINDLKDKLEISHPEVDCEIKSRITKTGVYGDIVGKMASLNGDFEESIFKLKNTINNLID